MFLTIDPAIIEALKIFGHFFITAALVIMLKRLGMKPITALSIAFITISIKELIDLQYVYSLELDDLALNFAGSIFGSSV